MTTMVDIKYSGFHDVPLAFVARHKGRLVLFWREFSEELDEYPDDYQVYLLPESLSNDDIEQWQGLRSKAEKALGSLPVKNVTFDSTRRKAIDSSILENLLPV